MLLSTRTSYSIRALYELAKYYGKKPISISYISEKEQIPETYLEQLLFMLKGAGIVSGVRGINGGYVLSRSPEEINLTDILKVTEGDNIISKCLMTGDTCPAREFCPAHDLLIGIQDDFFKYLSTISLQDILENNKSKEGDLPVEKDIP